MGKYLDLDDVAAGNPRAIRELAEMRGRMAELEVALKDAHCLAVGWAGHYQYLHRLPGFHPTHAGILDRCSALLTQEES